MRRLLLGSLTVALVTAMAVPAAAERAPEPITVLGPFAIDTAEGDAFTAELDAFTTENRLEVVYEEYLDIVDLMDRVTGEDPPDLIVSPQPGMLLELAPELVDLSEFVNPAALRRDFGSYLIDLVTVDGAILGGPIKLDLKSLVWYEPAAFEAEGYSIPTSFDELVALSDMMVADGDTPWCNYIDSGFATGWMGTDWVEDLLLGAEGPDVYDKWVDHTVLFVDPRVETAFQRFQQMIDTAGYVFERDLMLGVPFFYNAEPLGSGECLMHKQATFFTFFLEGFGFDVAEFATFQFPSVEPELSDAQLGASVYVAALSERREVRQLVRFMLSQRFGCEALAASGGWLLPNVRFDTSRYPDELTRSWAEVGRAALRAGQFRFDGSDLMPPEVGAGTFWSGIVDLVSGAKAIPEILADIDASWPT